jgi:hypothetical protein
MVIDARNDSLRALFLRMMEENNISYWIDEDESYGPELCVKKFLVQRAHLNPKVLFGKIGEVNRRKIKGLRAL